MVSKQFKTPQDISYDVMQEGLDVSFRGPDSDEYEQQYLCKTCNFIEGEMLI